MTTGIAYGTKIISRENREIRVARLSRTSAAMSETSIWTGMSTSENRRTNPTPLRNSGSVNARA